MRFAVKLVRVQEGEAVGLEKPAVLVLSRPRAKRLGTGKTHDAKVVAGRLASVRTMSLEAAKRFRKGESVPFWFRGHRHAVTRARA